MFMQKLVDVITGGGSDIDLNPLNPVVSSNLAQVGYDEAERVLLVEFNSGVTWEYYDVPQSVYDELITAPSKGSYFYWNVRKVYNGSKVIG